MKFIKPRGTVDLFDNEVNYFEKVIETLKVIAKMYCFNQIITPMFESKELFESNIGDTTDIVTKELYDFLDKGDRKIALRPEGTLPVIRSVVENKLIHTKNLPIKFFYYGPMFRYERPQSGRQRQFHQFGVETIGINNVYQQIELILMSLNILNTFKIKKFVLKINYIGSLETRINWINKLKSYFSLYKDKLTEDSIERLSKNPLRILDDKIDGKKDFVVNAPKVDEFLTQKEIEEKKQLIDLLTSLKIDFQFDNTMVRGLDYYSGLVFEFVSLLEQLNNQSTLIGGGKYENIFTKMEEKNLPCIGFGLGIERLIVAIKNEAPINFENKINIYLANLCSNPLSSFFIINLLRSSGFSIDGDLSVFKLEKHFKIAEKYQPQVILIFGEKEKEQESIIVKNQNDKKEKIIKINNLVKELIDLFDINYMFQKNKS